MEQFSPLNTAIEIKVDSAFGNLYRARCVLIALEDLDGQILVAEKPSFYPPTINRLPGGGADPEEDFRHAALREVKEETGIDLELDELTQLFEFQTSATDNTGATFNNVTEVYFAHIGSQRIQAGDDVAHLSRLTLEELYELGRKYAELSPTLYYKGPEGEFSWADYAKMYGPIHELVARCVADLHQNLTSR